VTDENDLPEDMVREHWRRVCAWVRRYDRRQPLGQRLDDGAVASEVFEEALKIWRRTAPGERPPREKWVPWLSTITKYKIYAAIRARDKQERTVRELQANTIPRQDHVRDPADDVVSREALDYLYKCVHGLPEPDRSILFLIWDGKSVAEAARDQGLTRAAAGMRVTRIKKYLRDEGGFAEPTDAMKALREAFRRGRNDGVSDA
jgi:RNA polymerase sigma factor (sigma-70 family)